MLCNPAAARRLTRLHLSVSVFVGVTAALALPPELLQLGLAALDGLRFGPPLALVLLQGGLRANEEATFNVSLLFLHKTPTLCRRIALKLFKFMKTGNILSVWAYCEVFNIQFQLLLQLGEQLGVKQLQLVTKKKTFLDPEHQQVLI